jgi:hypothetical protein
MLGVGERCWAGPNYYHKVALHVVPHGVDCKSLPAFARCADITTSYAGTGDIDVVPVFFDLKECLALEFGLTWPPEWGTCAYVSCIEGVAVGGIVNPGDALATAWHDCRTDWSISPGYGWIDATGPGRLSLVPSPKTNWIGVVNCGAPSVRGYDWPAAIFSAGVGGIAGDDPCEPSARPVKLTLTNGRGERCVHPGDTLTYKITYDNSENQSAVRNASLVFATDPRHAEILSASPGMRRSPGNSDIVWPSAAIGPAETGSIEVVLRVRASAESTLSTISRLAGDRTPLAADTVSSRVCPPELRVLQLAIADDLAGACARPRGRIAYIIRYGNPNSVPVHGASLIYDLPRAADLVSKSAGGIYDRESRKVTWAPGYLEPGRSDSVKVVVKVKAGPGETVQSTCALTADEAVEASASGSAVVCSKASGSAKVKVAIHVMAHSPGPMKAPVFTRPSQLVSSYPGTGEIEFIPVIYDLDGYLRLEFGLTWPEEWGSCQFTVAAGDIWAGGITESGEGIMIGWGSCQHTWSVSAGSGRLVATGPGRICPTPNPMSKRLGAMNCASPEAAFDSAQGVCCAGIGGAPGDPPRK